MESERTADARCSGALLRAAETLSNVLPGHSPPCYAGALLRTAPVLYPTLRRGFPIREPALSSALRRLSSLSYASAAKSRSPTQPKGGGLLSTRQEDQKDICFINICSLLTKLLKIQRNDSTVKTFFVERISSTLSETS